MLTVSSLPLFSPKLSPAKGKCLERGIVSCMYVDKYAWYLPEGHSRAPAQVTQGIRGDRLCLPMAGSASSSTAQWLHLLPWGAQGHWLTCTAGNRAAQPQPGLVSVLLQTLQKKNSSFYMGLWDNQPRWIPILTVIYQEAIPFPLCLHGSTQHPTPTREEGFRGFFLVLFGQSRM